MATSIGALPKETPFGTGELVDPARQEYLDATDKIVKALEARGNNNVNLWNVAGAFLNPGRTGSFGEGLSNAATSVGKDMDRAQEYQLPIAQMKAQLAKQKYDMAQNTQILGTLNQLYGGDLLPQVGVKPATPEAPAGAVMPPLPPNAAPMGGTPGVSSTSPVLPPTVRAAPLPPVSAAPPPNATPAQQQTTAMGQTIAADGGWLPDRKTVTMMLAANKGDAAPVLQEIAKARMKLSEPTDMQKDLMQLDNPNISPIVKQGIRAKYLESDVVTDLKALDDPNVDPKVKMGIANKYFADGLKPFTVQTPKGTVQTNAFAEMKKFLPEIFGQKTSGAAPAAAPAPAAGARPVAAAPVAAAPVTPTAVGAGPVNFMTTSEGFKVPVPPTPDAIPTPTGLDPSSQEALAARSDAIKANTEYMYRKEGPLDRSRIRYESANNNLQNYTNVIDSVKNMKGGIAAVPLQTWDKVIDAFGFSSPDQYRRMLSTATVDKASKEIVANELRAAFGGNPTEGERKYLNDALISISDPKELLLFTALTKKAIAMRDISRFEYLSSHIPYGIKAETTFDTWARKQPLSLFEPTLKAVEGKIFSNRGNAPAGGEAAPAARPPVYLGGREIIPNANNTGWVYKDNGKPAQ